MSDAAAQAGSAMEPRGDVVLLIDWENIQIELGKQYGATPRPDLLVREAADRGRLVLARAYANWTQRKLAIDAENVYVNGIDPVYVPTRKNSADVRMAVDAVDLCGSSEGLRTFILVTGDGDLIHPLNFLRLKGRRVVVIAVGGTMAQQLGAAADVVLIYEKDVDPSITAARRPPTVREADVRMALGMSRAGTGGVPGAVASPTGTFPQPGTIPSPGTVPTLASISSPALGLPPAGAVSGAPVSRPPMETAFGYVVDVLTRRGDNGRLNFQLLGKYLGDDYRFNCREWYKVPFAGFITQAADRGLVRIETHGDMSYAVLPSSVVRPLDEHAPSDREEQATAADSREVAEVQLESLTTNEQRDLLRALDVIEKESTFPYVTFTHIINNLTYHRVLPRLSETQLRRLINHLMERDPPILRWAIGEKIGPSGASYAVKQINLNRDHPALQRAAIAFRELPAALEEASNGAGETSTSRLRAFLEQRTRAPLAEIGFDDDLAFFREAERRCLVVVRCFNDGTDTVVAFTRAAETPEEPAPAAVPLDDHWTRECLRWLLAAEVLVGGPVELESAAELLHRGLRLAIGPDSTLTQLRRLLEMGMPPDSAADGEAPPVRLMQVTLRAPDMDHEDVVVHGCQVLRDHPLLAEVNLADLAPVPNGVGVRRFPHDELP